MDALGATHHSASRPFPIDPQEWLVWRQSREDAEAAARRAALLTDAIRTQVTVAMTPLLDVLLEDIGVPLHLETFELHRDAAGRWHGHMQLAEHSQRDGRRPAATSAVVPPREAPPVSRANDATEAGTSTVRPPLAAVAPPSPPAMGLDEAAGTDSGDEALVFVPDTAPECTDGPPNDVSGPMEPPQSLETVEAAVVLKAAPEGTASLTRSHPLSAAVRQGWVMGDPLPPNPFAEPIPDMHAWASVVAQAYASDLGLIHPARVARAATAQDEELRAEWTTDVAAVRTDYERQVGAEVARTTRYLEQALNTELVTGRRIF